MRIFSPALFIASLAASSFLAPAHTLAQSALTSPSDLTLLNSSQHDDNILHVQSGGAGAGASAGGAGASAGAGAGGAGASAGAGGAGASAGAGAGGAGASA